MALLKVGVPTISIDGYLAGPGQSLEQPMGAGTEHLHDWAFATRYFHQMHGDDGGGEDGPDDDLLRSIAQGVGATIMGRNMFAPVRGAWTEPAWNGWWGDEPPFGHPVFVLTHFPRDPLTLGRTTFHFVTEGPEAALEQAFVAADGGDVAVGGGASTIRQYLRAGLVDELHLAISPVVLGAGEALLIDLGDALRVFDVEHVRTTPAAAHFRLTRGTA